MKNNMLMLVQVTDDTLFESPTSSEENEGDLVWCHKIPSDKAM
jgi:hypothetical protein